MNRFLGFVQKEFYHIFRDYRSLIILFGMPVVQIFLFGFALTNEIKNAPFAVVDKSHDYVTQRLINKITSSGYFTLVKNASSEKELETLFKDGSIKEAIIFQPKFAHDLFKDGKTSVQILADATDPNTANILVNYTGAIIQSYNKELIPVGTVLPQIIPEVRMRYNPEMKGVYMFIPGLMAMILMLVSAMMTSIAITREKELGTMEILLVSPLHPLQIIIGKVIPYLFLSFINSMVILLFAKFVFGITVQGNYFFLIGVCVLFVTLALSLGIFISTATDSQQTAMMMSMFGLILPTILLSGFIFPISSMPFFLQVISYINPTTYFLIIIKGIMHKGSDITFLWKEVLILIVYILFFIAMSIRKFRTRLE